MRYNLKYQSYNELTFIFFVTAYIHSIHEFMYRKHSCSHFKNVYVTLYTM